MNITPEWAAVYVAIASISVTVVLAIVGFYLQWYLSQRDKPPPSIEVRVKRKRR